MDATRFEQGQTFSAFVEAAVQLKELWDDAVKRLHVPEGYVDELREVPGHWHLVALTEDWCLDAVSTLTPVAKLIDQMEHMTLRVFARDRNLDIMDTHLTDGGRSIPTVIVYDDQWQERGWWGPRPAELQQWVKTIGKTVPKEEKYRHIRGWYARDKGLTALREVTDLISYAGGARPMVSASVHLTNP